MRFCSSRVERLTTSARKESFQLASVHMHYLAMKANFDEHSFGPLTLCKVSMIELSTCCLLPIGHGHGLLKMFQPSRHPKPKWDPE